MLPDAWIEITKNNDFELKNAKHLRSLCCEIEKEAGRMREPEREEHGMLTFHLNSQTKI